MATQKKQKAATIKTVLNVGEAGQTRVSVWLFCLIHVYDHLEPYRHQVLNAPVEAALFKGYLKDVLRQMGTQAKVNFATVVHTLHSPSCVQQVWYNVSVILLCCSVKECNNQWSLQDMLDFHQYVISQLTTMDGVAVDVFQTQQYQYQCVYIDFRQDTSVEEVFVKMFTTVYFVHCVACGDPRVRGPRCSHSNNIPEGCIRTTKLGCTNPTPSNQHNTAQP